MYNEKEKYTYAIEFVLYFVFHKPTSCFYFGCEAYQMHERIVAKSCLLYLRLRLLPSKIWQIEKPFRKQTNKQTKQCKKYQELDLLVVETAQ